MPYNRYLATIRTDEGKEVKFTISAASLKHAWKKAGKQKDPIKRGEVVNIEAK